MVQHADQGVDHVLPYEYERVVGAPKPYQDGLLVKCVEDVHHCAFQCGHVDLG